MCGICGIVNVDASQPVDQTALHEMCELIHHRGPDEDGFFFSGPVGLGMRRLSIIDLSGGSQPIFNETHSAVIVFNGEIYNHRALHDMLVERGHCFRTHSDTEAIIHGYEEWGEDCVQHLNGMFAFAIWDRDKRRLFIARDRLGEKPLYYYHDQRRLIFGSEIKSILSCLGQTGTLKLSALDSYLSLGYVPAPDTLFEHIHKLPPGHCLSWQDGHLAVRRYWQLRFDPPDSPWSWGDACQQLRALLEDSVRARLMSDVPLGAFLSGGIDSSLIVGLMSRMMNRPVDTFSVGFAEKELNELQYAKVAADAFHTNHHELLVDHCGPDLVEKLVWHFDEPVADPAAVPTYLVSQLARRHVKVVLTGEGSDELLAGYGYYEASAPPMLERMLPVGVSRRLLPTLARSVNVLLQRQRYHPRTMWHWSLPPEERMVAWVAIFTDDEKAQLCTGALAPHLTQRRAYQAFADWYQRCNATDELHRLMYIDTNLWLPDDLLMKVDKMSMANSLEARAPFLNPDLFEFAAQLPPHFKRQQGSGKLILREVVKELLPPAIINRPKHTFDVPIERWLRTTLRDFARDLFSHSFMSEFVRREYVLGPLWQALEAGVPGVARQLWSLLLLEVWLRRYQIRLP